MLDEVDQRPAQCRHQVRHRRDVDQRDVECDPTQPDVVGFLGPRVDDPLEQRAAVQ
jgi:hypothetical protein